MSSGQHERLTDKQRMVLDYMRGNGCALTLAGWQHLVRRGSLTNRGISQVLRELAEKGLVECSFPPDPQYHLTEEGRRVQ